MTSKKYRGEWVKKFTIFEGFYVKSLLTKRKKGANKLNNLEDIIYGRIPRPRTTIRGKYDFAGWPRVYENDPYKIAELHGVEMNNDTKRQILGGEASLMGHQVNTVKQEGKCHMDLQWQRQGQSI